MHPYRMEIVLDRSQYRVAKKYADRTGLEMPDGIVRIWWGRINALSRYERRKNDRRTRINLHIPRRLPTPMRRLIREAGGR